MISIETSKIADQIKDMSVAESEIFRKTTSTERFHQIIAETENVRC